ncbi:MAG: acylneuraminate cytidylyltransferase family protein [Planctomycetes bacterium]|nr:acylneuraminate cytidylyltransferase family protein [Planctomycetota bacterium]
MAAPRPTAIALVPARSGSKRVKGKNVRILAGHPLIAYAISAARQAGVFQAVVVSTDSEEIAAVARHYGADVPFLRPPEYAGDQSPDIEWIEHLLRELARQGRTYDCFGILRPTSPFRLPSTVRRAWDLFLGEAGADSLRAVERCSQHPGKMWVVRGRRLLPLLPFGPPEQPWHSTPTQALPAVYVQNASLELAWTRVVLEGRTIAGETVVPFVTEGLEGFDINQPEDWEIAQALVASGEARLPEVAEAPCPLAGAARPV